jgi:hypothetical protein
MSHIKDLENGDGLKFSRWAQCHHSSRGRHAAEFRVIQGPEGPGKVTHTCNPQLGEEIGELRFEAVWSKTWSCWMW